MNGSIYEAKTKALISGTVTVQLISYIVFEYAKTGFLMTRLMLWVSFHFGLYDSASCFRYALFADDESHLSSHLKQNLPIIVETDGIKSG